MTHLDIGEFPIFAPSLDCLSKTGSAGMFPGTLNILTSLFVVKEAIFTEDKKEAVQQ